MSDEVKYELISNDNIKDKIYTIRGVQVMLDSDLAAIYGYSTKDFNRQVKNNIERFDKDFMFQLTNDDIKYLSRCKNFTLNKKMGRGSNIKYMPYAFTEQGIYMLMTVLKGELAVKQSKMLVRVFKSMKDYIIQYQSLTGIDYVGDLRVLVEKHTSEIKKIKDKMVTKDELAVVIRDFTNPNLCRDYVIKNGEPVESDIAYSEIYSSANSSIFVIDNYISLKTILMLKSSKAGVNIIVFSDNIAKDKLTQKEVDDFKNEYPNIKISFKRTMNIYHDRYIILDYGTNDERIFHCGSSSKDAGNKVSSITTVENIVLYKLLLDELLKNPILIL